MSDATRGIYSKYTVTRTDGSSGPGRKHENCAYFVLDLEHDPFAIPALKAYAAACAATHPDLARDLNRIAGALYKPAPACGCREAMCPHSAGATLGPSDTAALLMMTRPK